MKAMKYSVLVIMLFAIASCGGPKEATVDAPAETKVMIKVKEAYIQQEIPGQEGVAIKEYLDITLEDFAKEKVTLNSVVFRTKEYNISSNKNHYRFDLSTGKQLKTDPRVKLNGYMATLHYTQNGKTHTKTIDKVVEKEPIYMP